MATLHCTVIDVGWGDSILLEFEDGPDRKFGLIDCNDSSDSRSALIHIKRRFELLGGVPASPAFEFVALTHHHADHANGLQRIIRTFGAKKLYYTDSPLATASTAKLVAFASANCPGKAVPVDSRTTNALHGLGSVGIEVIWPDARAWDNTNENNNSMVLVVRHAGKHIVLTGDLEADTWPKVLSSLPSSVDCFKVPHHGALDGMEHGRTRPWLAHFTRTGTHPKYLTSAHVHPHRHPHANVVTALAPHQHYRTDLNHHLKACVDSSGLRVSYSH